MFIILTLKFTHLSKLEWNEKVVKVQYQTVLVWFFYSDIGPELQNII